jgi:hypothetical protein
MIVTTSITREAGAEARAEIEARVTARKGLGPEIVRIVIVMKGKLNFV